MRFSQIGLALVLTLCACDGTQSEADAEPAWQTASDGGLTRYLDSAGTEQRSERIERCYRASDGFDCVIAFRAAVPMISVARETRAELNVRPEWSEASMTGYGCEIFGDQFVDANFFNEAIWAEYGVLRKNSVGISPGYERGRSWSVSEVAEFFKLNGIKNNRKWFSCRDLSNLFNKGSFASMLGSGFKKDIILVQIDDK